MKQTIKAILARFDGDRWKAADYCTEMMRYAHLRDEYREYKDAINGYESSVGAGQ